MRTREAYRAGMAAYAAGDDAQAVALLTPLADLPGAIGRNSRHFLGRAHQRIGRKLYDERRFADAVLHLQTAMRVSPSDETGRLLAACLVRTRRYEPAVGQFERQLAADPMDVSTRVRLALAQAQAGRRIAAQATLEAGIRLRPDAAELHYQLGVLLASEEQFETAETHLRRAIALEPSHAAAFERLAQICGATGRAERALRYLEAAHRLDPLNPRIAWQLNLLGQHLPDLPATERLPIAPVRSRWTPAALAELTGLIEREPEVVDAFLASAGDADTELLVALATVLERAVSAQETRVDLHLALARVHQRLGRTAEAMRCAETAVELDEQCVPGLILLAELLAAAGRRDEALTRLEQAVSAGGDYADVHAMRGRMLAQAGRTEDARTALRRALELNAKYRAAEEALHALPA